MLMEPMLRHVAIKDENQPQQEDEDEFFKLRVTEDVMRLTVSLQRHAMEVACQPKDGSGTNAEGSRETVTYR